jgi:transcription initiation factor IIE alpha subunit
MIKKLELHGFDKDKFITDSCIKLNEVIDYLNKLEEPFDIEKEIDKEFGWLDNYFAHDMWRASDDLKSFYRQSITDLLKKVVPEEVNNNPEYSEWESGFNACVEQLIDNLKREGIEL